MVSVSVISIENIAAGVQTGRFIKAKLIEASCFKSHSAYHDAISSNRVGKSFACSRDQLIKCSFTKVVYIPCFYFIILCLHVCLHIPIIQGMSHPQLIAYTVRISE
jgi:hypothetical protein